MGLSLVGRPCREREECRGLGWEGRACLGGEHLVCVSSGRWREWKEGTYLEDQRRRVGTQRILVVGQSLGLVLDVLVIVSSFFSYPPSPSILFPSTTHPSTQIHPLLPNPAIHTLTPPKSQRRLTRHTKRRRRIPSRQRRHPRYRRHPRHTRTQARWRPKPCRARNTRHYLSLCSIRVCYRVDDRLCFFVADFYRDCSSARVFESGGGVMDDGNVERGMKYVGSIPRRCECGSFRHCGSGARSSSRG